jgi:ABC-type transport system involved in multi-copper enzyme maturation permease subunit
VTPAPDRVPATTNPIIRAPHPGLVNACSAELLKVRRQRSTWILSGLGVLALALVLLVLATSQSVHLDLLNKPAHELDRWLSVLEQVFAAGAGIALLILGSRLMGMEFGLGTVRIVLARGTGRGTLLAAKLLAMAAVALTMLIAYVVLAGVGSTLALLHQTGSTALLTNPPSGVWHHALVSILAAAISALACVVVGVTVATLTRSLAAAMAVALVFFPVDNTLVVILTLLHRATHISALPHVTAYLLGPTLNHLPAVLKVEAAAPFAIPTVPVGLIQTLAVVAGWLVALAGLAAVSLRRRDLLS